MSFKDTTYRVHIWHNLNSFLVKPEFFAFLLQVDILTSLKKYINHGFIVTERSPKVSTQGFSKMQQASSKTLFLRKGNLREQDVTALEIYEQMILIQPDYIIFIQVELKEAMKRIKKRGRPFS